MPATTHNRVRANWMEVESLSDEFARVFYANLFRLDPSTKPLFKSDIDAQGQKLFETLRFIIHNLDHAEELSPAVEALSLRHVSYGVTRAHYTSVLQALILSLHHLLGPSFDAEDEAAWRDVYDELTSKMFAVAYPS